MTSVLILNISVCIVMGWTFKAFLVWSITRRRSRGGGQHSKCGSFVRFRILSHFLLLHSITNQLELSVCVQVKGISGVLLADVRAWLLVRDKLIWQKLEFLYCHKNLGLNDQDRKIYGIICYCCHIGNYPPWQLLRVKQLIIYLYLNSNCATFPT